MLELIDVRAEQDRLPSQMRRSTLSSLPDGHVAVTPMTSLPN
jgi:hypothetical protein